MPVLFVSEMTLRDLSIRSLARQAGVEGYLLRDPKGPRGCRPLTGELTEGMSAIMKAHQVAKVFQEEAGQFLTPIDRRTRTTVDSIEIAVDRIREHWQGRGAGVPSVLVFVDPIHRILDSTRPEIEALGQTLTAIIDMAQRTDSVVVFSSDTTKSAAGGRSETNRKGRSHEIAQAVEGAFRGNYQLLHLPDVALGS